MRVLYQLCYSKFTLISEMGKFLERFVNLPVHEDIENLSHLRILPRNQKYCFKISPKEKELVEIVLLMHFAMQSRNRLFHYFREERKRNTHR